MNVSGMCVICDHRDAAPRALTCPRCRTALRDDLATIATLYGHLDPTPGSAGSNAGGRAPGYGSRSPARDDVLVLTDTRRNAATPHDPDRPRNAQAVIRVLAYWADTARDDGILARRRIRADAPSEALALASVVDELARRYYVAEMAAAVDGLVLNLRRATGDVEPLVPLGRCARGAGPSDRILLATLVADLGRRHAAAADVPRCGGTVRARAMGAPARCDRCRTRWSGDDELRDLAVDLGDAMLDLPGLSRYLDVSSLATLRSWAHRDGWDRVKVGRRTLYRLSNAQASWWAARLRAAAVEPATVDEPLVAGEGWADGILERWHAATFDEVLDDPAREAFERERLGTWTDTEDQSA